MRFPYIPYTYMRPARAVTAFFQEFLEGCHEPNLHGPRATQSSALISLVAVQRLEERCPADFHRLDTGSMPE